MPLDIQQLIKDKSGDRDYFAMVPGLLWPDIKLCSGSSTVEPLPVHVQEIGIELNIYDKWLYASLKKICGENDGQCFLSTRGLAKFASMSIGQTSKSKAKLAEAGLIEIVCKKRSVKGQAIDHITVVDIWEENIKLMKARKEGVHLMNALEAKQERSRKGEKRSQDEHQPPERSQGEGKCSQGETEEEPIEEEPKGEEEKEEKPSIFPEKPKQPGPASAAREERDDEKADSKLAVRRDRRNSVLRHDGSQPAEAGRIADPFSGGRGDDVDLDSAELDPLTLDLARATASARAEAGAWTAPPPGGGDDAVAAVALACFCEMQGEAPTEEEHGAMLLELSETLKPLKASPGEVEAAFEIMAEDFKYRVGNYNPFQDSFKNDLATCIRRARGRGQGGKTPDRRARYDTPAVRASQAAFEERRAARPPPVEGDPAWEQAKHELALQMTKPTFETWVRDTYGLGQEDGVYTVVAPDALTRDWLDNRLKTTARRTLVGILNKQIEVRFEVSDA